MKGIILAGGSGTRLYPLTIAASKSLLPVFDKPMVYYPLATLMMADIRDILIISTPHHIGNYQQLLGDGHDLGIRLSYSVQETAKGLAQAFHIGANFVGNSSVALALGDNIIYGYGLGNILRQSKDPNGAVIFATRVKEPQHYGVVQFDDDHNIISIEEKPLEPKSNFAVPGLYFYSNDVIDISRTIQPSARGEYEITDINISYLQQKRISVKVLDHNINWHDCGTEESLLKASEMVRNEEQREGLKIGAIESEAYIRGFIDDQQLRHLAKKCAASNYGEYLRNVALNLQPKGAK